MVQRASPAVGIQFLAEHKRALSKVGEAPARWPQYFGAHRFRFKGFPYSMVYDLASDGVIEVLAVAHDRLPPGYWRQRKS